MLSQMWTTIQKVREFRRNETLSRAEFDELKLRKFRRLVKYVGQRSAYYARIIQERRIDIDTCVPGDFPLLTKSILMANFDDIVTDPRLTKQAITDFLARSTDPTELFLNQYHVVHSSGSSGEVGYFVYSRKDWTRGRAQAARISHVAPKKKAFRRYRFAFYGATGGHYVGVSTVSAAKRGIAKWSTDIGIFDVNSPLPQTVQQLNAFQPDFIHGYTAALKALAGEQLAGTLRLSLGGIEAGGEGLTQADKTLLEQAFNCPSVSRYGCTEHLLMGVSIPDTSRMILYDDDLIYEFFEDHSVVTNLFNYTLPLIRYRMSDILRVVAVPDSTSPYPIIDSLVGRAEIVPRFINQNGTEDTISPIMISMIFIPGVKRHQMRLLNKTSFQFLVCFDATLNTAQRAESILIAQRRLQAILDQKMMGNVLFEVVAVDELLVNPQSRKFQFIVDARAS